MEEFGTSIASFWVTISLLLHLVFLLFLSSFMQLIVIAYLVINLLMPYVDIYTEAVVISMCIKQIN